MKHVLFGILAVLAFARCTKHACCPRYFQIPTKTDPIQVDYHIGDTITVTSKFHREVPALNSEKEALGTFDMQGINWKPISNVYRVDTIEYLNDTEHSVLLEYFDFIKDTISDFDIFQYSNGATGLLGKYAYANDTFFLRYSLVCKHLGTFYLENGSGVFAGHDFQDFPGKCGRNGFDVWTQMNPSGNNHVELLKDSPNTFWSKQLVDQENLNQLFSKLGGYCFRVVP